MRNEEQKRERSEKEMSNKQFPFPLTKKDTTMTGKARNFRDYQVWQNAVDYATLVYEITTKLPWFEKKGLCDQLQRAVVSISSNIAEGAGRPSDADFAHFLDQSLGSANEVETQLLISKNLHYITEEQYNQLLTKLTAIQKQLTGLIFSIRKQSSRSR